MAKLFWRLKKQDYYMAAIELKNNIPELKDADTERIEDGLKNSGLLFFHQERMASPVWLKRLTLPFALITMFVLILFLPFNYMIIGRWGYKILWLTNWFKSLGF